MEDVEEIPREIHPRDKGNFFKHLFFCWQLSVVVKGWKKELDEDDLYAPFSSHRADLLGNRAEALWVLEKKRSKKPSLYKVLIKIIGLECLFYGFIYLPVNLLFVFGKPIFLKTILDYFSFEGNVTLQEAYINGSLIILTTFLNLLLFNFTMNQMNALGIKVRVACSSLVFRHILKMRKNEIQQITPGHVINLLTNDAVRLEEGLAFFHFLWIAPLQIILAVGYVYVILDYRAISGIGAIVFFFLIEVLLSTQVAKYRRRVVQKTDQRLRLVNDIVSGIHVIKMHTWEEPFGEMVDDARRLEVEELKKSNFVRFILSSFGQLLPLCILVVVVVLVFTDSSLSSQYIYSVINIYTELTMSTLLTMPSSLINFLDFHVSVGRIQKFLLINYDNVPSIDLRSEKKHVGIYLGNISVKIDDNVVLKKSTFWASSGELVGVVGKAGSGKSTLLQVILKEIEVTGTVIVDGDVSYASQDPWIFPSTIRQNILFGEDFDLERYIKVMKICALKPDLASFPHSDQTLVDDKGVMLSGGQKARINLARAIYKKADIYLLDDPLSAVDAHVAQHIYKECITKFLRNKCVILVTHQVHFLQNATRLYLVENGKIRDCDRHANFKFEDIPKKESPNSRRMSFFDENQKPEITKEHRTSGVYSIKNYKRYIQASGHWCFIIGVILLFVLSQCISSFLNVFLSYWINQDSGNTSLDRKYFLIVYSGSAILLIFALCTTFYTTTEFCANSSKNLHNNLLRNVINGTMTFFNHHPAGRILNRFSKDIGCVDENVPSCLVQFLIQSFSFIGLLVIISVINYWMIIASLVLCIVVCLCCIAYQPTNRNLKRTEGLTKSHVLSYLIATLQGLTTIRAFKAQKILSTEFDKHQDLSASATYLYSSTFDSLGFWMSLFSVVYTGIFIFSSLSLPIDFKTASIGMAITLALTLCEVYPYMVKGWSQIETHMTSVERIVEYTDLDPEANNDTVVPPENWPTTGQIIFDSVSMKYSPGEPLVLNQVTFKINSNEKIGIIGRTGAGKTSLIAALFRLYYFDGSITIDGLDTKSIPLKTLRSKISVIPQDPILFVGTLRKNLDPFSEFSDAKIWQVLDELELKASFTNLFNGLDTKISEGGNNFSLGQRQLLCLVRAMLRESKIIALDEATANLDSKTDELIQSIIRKKFRNCTVLTIAHRLNTVIDSDKILVLDGGRVVEFDQPYKLLQNQQSFFYGFVKENGEEVLGELMELAKETAFKKSRIK